ncbi:MAG TPA: MFS transporter [Ktedonobacterales bacterium]
MTLETNLPLSYRSLFGVTGFPRLAIGAFLARTGSQMWQITLVLFTLQMYHSPELTGIAVFWSIVPGLVVSPIAGALLDRHGRTRMIILDYAVACASMALLVLLGSRGLLPFPVLVLIAAFSSLTGPLSASGTRSLFPMVVPPALWDRANAVDSGSMALSAVAGPALAGILVARIGGYQTFLISAIFFGLAAVILFGVAEPKLAGDRTVSPLLRSALEGFLYTIRHPTLRGVMYTFWLANMMGGILTIALPVMVLQSFHAGTDAAGALWAVSGVATVIAGFFIGRGSTLGRERQTVAVGMVCLSAGMAVMIIPHSVPALIAGMVVSGIGFGAIDIGLFALRQRRLDPAWFGRALAVSMSLNFAATPVGSIIAGPLVAYSIPLALTIAAFASLLGAPVVMLTVPRDDARAGG